MSGKKRILAGLMGVLLVAGLIGAGLYVSQNTKKPAAPKQEKKQAEPLPHSPEGYDKKYEDALKAIAEAKNREEKGTAYIKLGAAAMNAEEYKAAIDAYEKSLEVWPENKRQVLSGLGYAYARDGQKDKAIATFREMIDLLKKSGDPYASSAIEGFENDIKAIERGDL